MPEPEGPVTTVNPGAGKETVTPRRLWVVTPRSSRGAFRGGEPAGGAPSPGAGSSRASPGCDGTIPPEFAGAPYSPRSAAPVGDSGHEATSPTLPATTIRPPSGPLPGPTSVTRSAARTSARS
ncbi:MAG: hypothetical protein IPP07_04285 [Holophagales bacterium]|nr:hypothetical protein [Holophagales bacterium]